jgi:hypothetical protein
LVPGTSILNPVEQRFEILACELPLERLGNTLPPGVTDPSSIRRHFEEALKEHQL